MKAGDAKLWVYYRKRDYDCQAAEDHKIDFCVVWPGLSKVRLFLSDGYIHHANPVGIGNAKGEKPCYVISKF